MLCRIPSRKPEEVIAETDKVFVVVPLRRDKATGEMVEWDRTKYRLVIPRHHAEDIAELTGVWDDIMLEAKRQKDDMGGEAIISFNQGASAGQTQPHLHVWVVRCSADDPTAGKGLATMKELLDELLRAD